MLHTLGNLNNGANAGLFCLNGNNALSNTRWNIASRQSDHSLSLEQIPRRVYPPRKASGHAASLTKIRLFDAGPVAISAKAREAIREKRSRES